MRKRLEAVVGQRLEFIATISKFGFTLGNKVKQQTILLIDVIQLNTLTTVTNHCWIIMQKSIQKVFKKLKIKKGQIIKFSSLVIQYTKTIKINGAYTFIKDYKLDKLKSIKLISV